MLGQTLNQRYLLTASLGKGAMGMVYRATDVQTGQAVAVKMLSPDLAPNPEILERFRREGEALRRLKHPNIVGFVDMFEHGRQLVIVMEYMPGGSLHTLIKQGPLPLARARHIALDVCDALIRAHRLGIIHRDIKPENILLADDGSPKLTDFGVAHLTSENNRLTATGTQVGTPYYMSPEAWEGQPLDAQTDIWSLGVVLFEMLTGQLPFEGGTAAAVMTKVLMTPPPDLRQLRPEVPPGLAQIVAGMLARDRAARYQTIREASVDLERGERLHPAVPVSAPVPPAPVPPPPAVTVKAGPQPKPARKPAPRWLGWAAGLAGLGIVIVLGLVAARSFLSAAADNRPTATPTRFAATRTSAPAVIPSQPPTLSPVAPSATVLAAPTATNRPSPTAASATAATPIAAPTFTATPAPTALPSATAAPSPTPLPTTAPVPTATATVTTPLASGPTGRIAFVSDRDGKGQEVYVINADGTGLIQLTDTLGNKAGGIGWRPDGTGLTFSWAGGLYNIDLNPGATPQALLTGKVDNFFQLPAWSPDGKRLAYSFWCRGTECDSSAAGTYVAEPKPRLVSPQVPTRLSTLTWTADSRRLLLAFDTGLYSLEVDTSLRQKIGDLPNFTPVAWSPDGARLAGFAGIRGSQGNKIFLADASGANAVQPNMAGNNTGPAWSPDGQYLAFCSDRDGNYEIYIMKADGTGQTNLTNNPADDCPDQTGAPAWGR